MLYNLTCTFAGHRMFIFCRNLDEKLYNILENLILMGVSRFLIGTHGEFDQLALRVCLKLREKYSHIKINLVLTSFKNSKEDEIYYKQINIELFSYEIENLHYKQRIITSNQMMVDESDYVVAFVDTNLTNSGAYKTLKYAENKNKIIINLGVNQ